MAALATMGDSADIHAALPAQGLDAPYKFVASHILVSDKNVLIATGVRTDGAPMLDITRDIQSLTTFRRRSGDFMKQLRKTKRPVVITVKGKAQAVVQDAEAYQRLLEIAARADVMEGIRQGLEEERSRKGRPVWEFFSEFRAKHGIPR